MSKLQRIVTWLMWPMVLFLPFWITLGRAFFGSSGWVTFISITSVAPVLLGVLLVINIIIVRITFKRERLVTKPQAIVLALLYCCIFLTGVFLVDGGDTPESVGSVATRILGNGFENTSNLLTLVFGNASIVLLLAAFAVALSGRFTWVRSRKIWIRILTIIVIASGIAAGLYVWHNNDPAVKDEQLSEDFQLIKNDIQDYDLYNNWKLPSGSAEQIAKTGKYSLQNNVAERAANYRYIPLQEKRQFKLCAIFATDTMSNHPGTADGSDNAFYHHNGYQCFTYDE